MLRHAILRPCHAARGQRSAAPSPKPRASPQAPREVQPAAIGPSWRGSAWQCLPVGRTVCGLHGNLAMAVDAAPASAAVEALDVSVRVAAVGGVEVAEAPQIGVTHHSHGGGARVGHLVGARARTTARARSRARFGLGLEPVSATRRKVWAPRPTPSVTGAT